MGYTSVGDFFIKDVGDDYLNIRLDEENGIYNQYTVSTFDKDDIDEIIKTLQTARDKKWGKENGC